MYKMETAHIVKTRQLKNGNWKIIVKCPYCDKTHNHGDTEQHSTQPRIRGSHCNSKAYKIV